MILNNASGIIHPILVVSSREDEQRFLEQQEEDRRRREEERMALEDELEKVINILGWSSGKVPTCHAVFSKC